MEQKRHHGMMMLSKQQTDSWKSRCVKPAKDRGITLRITRFKKSVGSPGQEKLSTPAAENQRKRKAPLGHSSRPELT